MSSASAKETGVGRYQVRVQTGPHSFLMDEPVAVGGRDSGPSPFDMLCTAIASCTLMTLKLYASHKGWALDGMGVKVIHHKGSAVVRDRFETTLDLGNANDEQRAALLKIAQRCPVHLLIENGAEAPTGLATLPNGPPQVNRPLGDLAA